MVPGFVKTQYSLTMKKKQINSLLEGILKDRGVPRNIKNSVEQAIKILDSDDSDEIKIASIISILDESSSDPNLSIYARTLIWDVISRLEILKQG